ncbi:unnamed protein product, partial [Amoebophrya sp. A25]|eukprot:GSA25T00018562001.1
MSSDGHGPHSRGGFSPLGGSNKTALLPLKMVDMMSFADRNMLLRSGSGGDAKQTGDHSSRGGSSIYDFLSSVKNGGSFSDGDADPRAKVNFFLP